MEQGGTEMNDKIGDRRLLRDYLLRSIEDNVMQDRIEKQLMTDDDFGALIDAEEHELIEDYLDGELSEIETQKFEKFLLATPEGRRNLRLIENLRTFSERGAENVVPRAKRSMFDWTATLSIHWLRFAALAVLLVVAGVGIWRFAISESTSDKALAELRRAYQGQRLSEARLSAFPEYSPYSQTRGQGGQLVDAAARDRAQIYLSDATRGIPERGSNHALGLLYLAERNFERAGQEFAAGLAAAPEDAKLHSDIGAMYLEMARSIAGADPTGIVSLDHSLKNLERAIELAPRMPEPRFNKALVLEDLKLPDRAKKAWEEYLEIDPSSKWADEARRHLQQLDETAAAELTADELESRFIAAIREGNETAASDLVGKNRELIREKYLPQRLAMSYLNAPPDRRDELLSAMKYAGELELKRGDPFAKEIALFYSGLDEANFGSAREAQAEIVAGYRKCLAESYGDSIPHFKRARSEFEQMGNPWEAALAGYFVAYALHNVEMVDESLAELNRTAEFARRGKYIWLEATVSYWIGGVNMKMGRHSEGRRAHEHALALADRLQDSYSAQRNLMELARLSATGGQRSATLAYIRRTLEENGRPGNSIRQRFRNLSYIAEIFTDLGLLHAAAAAGMSSVNAASATGSNFHLATSMTKAGDVYIRIGDHQAARSLIEGGLAASLAINDTDSRNKTSALCYLKLADLERGLREFETAKQHYQRAIEFYRTAAMPFFLVQATNGLLLTELALGNAGGIEEGIAENIRFAEKYREQIADEQEKTSYFDRSVGIYEIAAEFEFDRGNYEKAYDYAERSSSRSLLDWLRKGTPTQKESVMPATRVGPEPLSRIREGMPVGSQLVQYTVLSDRVLVWLISKDRFTAHSLPSGEAELANKVAEFRHMIERRDERAGGLARELYGQLISPITEHIDGSKEIAIVPNGVLFTLPYAALTSPDGRPLIAEYEITYAPSANVFLHITERAARLRRPAEETVLAVGDPAFDRVAFNGLPYLSGAEREAKTIAEFYDGARTLTGKTASKPAVRAAMAEADVLHFAGHYVAEPHSPMSSYLLLAANGDPDSSKLSNTEMAGQDLSKLRLIVLAACRTGTEAYTAGEGPIGLSRTFLGANVPLVIGSQWSVDSEATADLMIRFHRHRRLGRLQTAAALRAAQLELLNDPTGSYTAPYYWSAFAVYGGHAGF